MWKKNLLSFNLILLNSYIMAHQIFINLQTSETASKNFKSKKLRGKAEIDYASLLPAAVNKQNTKN